MPLKVPPVNATLSRIESPGEEIETDYGYETGPPIERWAGSASAYSTEKHEISDAGTLVRTATIAIPSDIPSTAPVAPGDTVTFTRRGVEQARVVDAVEDRADAGFLRCFVRDAG